MVIMLGLAAAVLYGTGDFLGGQATRRAGALVVLALAQTAGVSSRCPLRRYCPDRSTWRAWPGGSAPA